MGPGLELGNTHKDKQNFACVLPTGSWSFQGECSLCAAILDIRKQRPREAMKRSPTWASAASMLWERFPFCTGSEASLDGVISTSVLVLFGSSIFSVTKKANGVSGGKNHIGKHTLKYWAEGEDGGL